MVNQEQLPAPRNLPWCGWAPLSVECVSSVTDVCSLLGGTPVKSLSCCLLPSDHGDTAQAQGRAFCWSSEPEMRYCCETEQLMGEEDKFADKWVNDTLIMVTLKDWEFSSLLLSVFWLREVMLLHKDLHAVPCWVCLYLSSAASSFVPWEPLTGSSCIAVVLFWSMIIKKIKTQFCYHVCNFVTVIFNLLKSLHLESESAWMDPVWPERKSNWVQLVCQLQTAWATNHVWTHPKFQGIFMCENLNWLYMLLALVNTLQTTHASLSSLYDKA